MDKYHLSNWVARIGSLMERALLMKKNGILDQENFERSVLYAKSLLSTPAGRKSYEGLLQEGLFGPELREYMESFYAELDPLASQAAKRLDEEEAA